MLVLFRRTHVQLSCTSLAHYNRCPNRSLPPTRAQHLFGVSELEGAVAAVAVAKEPVDQHEYGALAV
jgi:hypothetical protein